MKVEVKAERDIDETVQSAVRKIFEEMNPLMRSEAFPRQASMVVIFRPDRYYPKGKVINLSLTVPNHCDLRSRSAKERLIRDKYLAQWGLLEEA
ncbi:hypothetical protein [Magnetofaba australis]|uniref:hypothetical protein n=1 Tax=Magnetofaba australis TaxID=1472297 RepID=UPI0011807FFB|nr:hypothetical protein [Magnetofaba australis]